MWVWVVWVFFGVEGEEGLPLHHCTTKGLLSGMRSKKHLQGTKHTNSTHSPSERTTKQNFFRSYVLTKAKFSATGLAIHSKERVYVVDSGASLYMMGLSSLNHKEKKIIRHPSKTLGIQTTNGIVVSWRLSMDTFGERFSVTAIVGKTVQ